jgi:hypothetical protein
MPDGMFFVLAASKPERQPDESWTAILRLRNEQEAAVAAALVGHGIGDDVHRRGRCVSDGELDLSTEARYVMEAQENEYGATLLAAARAAIKAAASTGAHTGAHPGESA